MNVLLRNVFHCLTTITQNTETKEPSAPEEQMCDPSNIYLICGTYHSKISINNKMSCILYTFIVGPDEVDLIYKYQSYNQCVPLSLTIFKTFLIYFSRLSKYVVDLLVLFSLEL